MVVIHQLCENYGWSLQQAMKITMPQLILLNHSSWVSKERMDKRIEADKKNKDVDGPVHKGKHLHEMTTDEQLAYYGSTGANCAWD